MPTERSPRPPCSKAWSIIFSIGLNTGTRHSVERNRVSTSKPPYSHRYGSASTIIFVLGLTDRPSMSYGLMCATVSIAASTRSSVCWRSASAPSRASTSAYGSASSMQTKVSPAKSGSPSLPGLAFTLSCRSRKDSSSARRSQANSDPMSVISAWGTAARSRSSCARGSDRSERISRTSGTVGRVSTT